MLEYRRCKSCYDHQDLLECARGAGPAEGTGSTISQQLVANRVFGGVSTVPNIPKTHHPKTQKKVFPKMLKNVFKMIFES